MPKSAEMFSCTWWAKIRERGRQEKTIKPAKTAKTHTCRICHARVSYQKSLSVTRSLHQKHPCIFWEWFVLPGVGICIEHSSFTSKIQAVCIHGKGSILPLQGRNAHQHIVRNGDEVKTVLEIYSESLLEQILISFFNGTEIFLTWKSKPL